MDMPSAILSFEQKNLYFIKLLTDYPLIINEYLFLINFYNYFLQMIFI